ncbi:MAG: GntR family transcriptional regulator [Spirochaetota bacterium]
MANERKNGELTFVLDPVGGVPFYRQIILQVEMAIADGRLSAGTQLPTVRGLAVDLQINPNTVARAYNELEIRGIVTTQQGSGTFISDQQVDLTNEEREQILSRLVQSFLGSAASYGFSVDEIVSYLQRSRESYERTESRSGKE